MMNVFLILMLGLAIGYLLGYQVTASYIKNNTTVQLIDAFATFIRIHADNPREKLLKFREFIEVISEDPQIVEEIKKDLQEEGK